jgi:general secretion pathway protein B
VSFILDALRRADSERERGAVPGVHAQPVPLGSAQAPMPAPSRLWPAVSVALAAVLLAALGWQWLGRDAAPVPADAPPPVAAVAAPLPITPAPPPVVVAPAAEAAPPSTAAAPPVQAAVTARKPVPLPLPVKAVAPAPPPTPTPAVRTAADTPAPAASAPQASTRLPTVSELPEDIQRGLPTLVVGGASYSQNADSRMLIVNGQVLREGDKVAPEVTLEQIRLKEAVLSTKGHRWRIAY